MTPADMRARADWLEKWCEEKTTPAMLRAGADAIEEVERLRDVLSSIDAYLSDTLSGRSEPCADTYVEWLLDGIRVARHRARNCEWTPAHDAGAFLAALTPQEPNHD